MHQIALGSLNFAVDTAVKSLLVALVVGLGLIVLRVRDTNVRHRAWTAVLMGMLAMPILVLTTPAIPLPAWLAAHWRMADAVDDTTLASTVGPPGAIRPATPSLDRTPDDAVQAPSELPMLESNLVVQRDRTLPAYQSPGHTEPTPIQSTPTTSPGWESASWLRRNWATTVVAGYLVVAALMLTRLAVGLTLTLRFAGRSQTIVSDEIDVPLSRHMRLAEHAHAAVPLTVGWLRPVVVLPAAWRHWNSQKLRAVLTHELAHISRRDWLVSLLAEFNRAVHWLHPLSWFLRRRLSTLAEHNCDDAVLAAFSDRTQYARYLLEVASTLSASRRRRWATLECVAMARTSRVESRIDAILDHGRPLARRINCWAAAVVLAVGVPAVVLAAALRADPESATDGSSSPAGVESDSSPSASVGAIPTERIVGRVVDNNGEPVAGAVVFAAHSNEARRAKVECTELARTTADERGEFVLDLAGRLGENAQQDRAVVAFAEGFGPAWRTVPSTDERIEPLSLPPDGPIRGRIIDLEGNPVKGVRVVVSRLFLARSGEAIDEWLAEAQRLDGSRDVDDYLFSSPGGNAGPFPIVRFDSALVHDDAALASGAVSDADGRFELRGIGADRLALVEIEGPSIAKTLLHVVSRSMNTVAARPWELIGARAAVYYGSEFEFVAEPTQPIVGKVVDVDTNRPLVGATVLVAAYGGRRLGQQGFLEARTDDTGQYRLLGAPVGGGHRIEVDPGLDQPYFVTAKTLSTTTGLEPVGCDFQLKRGVWITGKAVDETDGRPISNAIVNCLPLRTNPHAEEYANYDPQITGHVPNDRLRTSADGTFRILGIPGDGVVFVVATDDDKARYVALAPNDVPDRLRAEDGSLRAYHPWTITGMNAICEIDVPEAGEAASCTLQLTPGLTRRIEIVDETGNPIIGVRVLGRTFPSSLEGALDRSSVEISGLRRDEQRIVAFIHPERQVGKAAVVAPGEALTVGLEPCAIVRGRVVDANDHPVEGLQVDVRVAHDPENDNWARSLIATTTNAEGEFEAILPPGLAMRVAHYSEKGGSFTALCQPAPGAVVELGDIKDGMHLGAGQTVALTTPPATARAADAPPARRVARRFVYEGQVLAPDGKPAPDAELHLVYWFSHPTATGRANPVARSGDDGRFRFEMMRDEFHRTGDSVPPWQWASLVAVADGYGPGWAQAALFETSGEALAEIGAPDNPAAANIERVREQIEKTAGRITLAPDDTPISGRIVDVDGQPVVGARIRLLELFQGEDGTLDAWLDAAEKPGAEFYSVRNTVPNHLYGALAQALVAPIKTDNDGRFTVRGVGRDRLVRLLVEGDVVEWTDLYCRTRPGDAIELVEYGDRKTVVHGPTFTQVVANSKPIVGTVSDKATGVPLAGVIVRSQNMWMRSAPGKITHIGNDYSHATTDENGKYVLRGMPASDLVHLALVPPADSDYLPTSTRANAGGADVASVEVDVAMQRGIVVTGHVRDAKTKAGVSGKLTYFLKEEGNQTALLRLTQANPPELPRVEVDGSFQVVVPNDTRWLAFTAFDPTYERNARLPDDASNEDVGPTALFVMQTGVQQPRFHALAELKPNAGDNAAVEFRVSRGAFAKGIAIDPEGEPVKSGEYWGYLDGADNSVWRPLVDGAFTLANYNPAQSRTIVVVDRDRKLAGAATIGGEIAPDLRIPLRPWGTLTARVLDEQGEPVSGMHIMSGAIGRTAMPSLTHAPGNSGDDEAESLPLPTQDRAALTTDDDGRFRIEGLAPGEKYSFSGVGQKNGLAALYGDIARNVVVEAGQTLDLGDVSLDASAINAARRNAEKPDAAP